MATSDVDMESFARLSLSLFEKRHDEPDASSEPSERSYWNEADQLLESVQVCPVAAVLLLCAPARCYRQAAKWCSAGSFWPHQLPSKVCLWHLLMQKQCKHGAPRT